MRFSLTSSAALRTIPAALLLCLGAVSAHAASPTKEQCSSNNPQVCQREAAAARQASRAGGLSAPTPEALERNALARCAVFKAEIDKEACEARVRNAPISGSVFGGGQLRQATTTVNQ